MMLEGVRPLNQDEKELLKDLKSQPRATQHFARHLNSLLKQKRYLIIMDDVWTPDLWDQVKDVLPNTENGSRVLITTRISNIATKAYSTCDPYNMRYLSVEESQELLLKNAFPFQDPKAYLHGLSDLPKKFARKCGNLPLALKIVGGRLSRELPTYNSWHKILQKLNWHDGDEKNCTDILATSYEDTPAYLKPCFMYFALYPEDYQIKVEPLIRMWVSEGFIPEKNGTTMEETAEDYLEELALRSMIQVVKRHYNGSIKYCRIHDLLHDLAIEKAKENNFLQIISNQGNNGCTSSTTVHRAAFHGDCEDVVQYTGPNLRSLFFVGYDTPNIDSFRNLKILCRINYYTGPHSKISKKMTQLRYFGNYTRPESATCWKNISHMRNLQTLHIDSTNDRPEADNIWNIKTLRHVLLNPSHRSFLGPPPNTNLPNLQTLISIRVRKSWLVEGWPKIPNIRVLSLCSFPQKYKESFCNFLNEIPQLTSLNLEYYSAPYERLDMSSFPSYNHMQSLRVFGEWNNYECIRGINQYKALDIRLFPIHLIELAIWECDFQEDPMPVIENLKDLKKLELFNCQHYKKQLSSSARGFPRLEYLELQNLKSLEEWKVEKGGMPLLKEISINFCTDLVAIPELQHMTRLNNLFLMDVHQDLCEKLLGEESYKLRHIPSVQIK
ncbi:Nbs-lrr resistance protein [Rhynchospora pubera]|uniref:Nbs-lrr resistance protein n=1 Tax=Rhynchospora pubera TaxID=906938 RepID=A0AAV8GVD7_9POAL|nr:Nbs-lrr resistance protein [Rhynchospora pubera]